MNGLKVSQVVVIQVHTDDKEQTSIAAVHNLEVTELEGRNMPEIIYCKWAVHKY